MALTPDHNFKILIKFLIRNQAKPKINNYKFQLWPKLKMDYKRCKNQEAQSQKNRINKNLFQLHKK